MGRMLRIISVILAVGRSRILCVLPEEFQKLRERRGEAYT